MIEFTLNRNKNGKKSRWAKKKSRWAKKYPRWAKKYPRERILKRGSEKAAGWYFHIYLSVRTKCLTAIKLERKHEK